MTEQRFAEATRGTVTFRRFVGRAFFFAGLLASALTIGSVLLLKPSPLGAALIGILCFSCVAVLLGFLYRPRFVAAGLPRALVMRGRELFFDAARGAEITRVADLDGVFGVTLLANRARSRVCLALTSERSTFYVGASMDEADRRAFHELLATAYTVASDEGVLGAAAPDGLALTLPGPELVDLLAAVKRLDGGCTSRLCLTDTHGTRVLVEAATLTVGGRFFDLRARLEWRATLFREAAFGGVSVFQATYVRQGENEVAFVALMPALSSPSVPGDVTATAEPELERAVLRDMGLLDAVVDEPPPTELRVAIERVFMLPLRAALDTAPRDTRPPSSALERRPS